MGISHHMHARCDLTRFPGWAHHPNFSYVPIWAWLLCPYLFWLNWGKPALIWWVFWYFRMMGCPPYPCCLHGSPFVLFCRRSAILSYGVYRFVCLMGSSLIFREWVSALLDSTHVRWACFLVSWLLHCSVEQWHPSSVTGVFFRVDGCLLSPVWSAFRFSYVWLEPPVFLDLRMVLPA